MSLFELILINFYRVILWSVILIFLLRYIFGNKLRFHLLTIALCLTVLLIQARYMWFFSINLDRFKPSEFIVSNLTILTISISSGLWLLLHIWRCKNIIKLWLTAFVFLLWFGVLVYIFQRDGVDYTDFMFYWYALPLLMLAYVIWYFAGKWSIHIYRKIKSQKNLI